MSAAMFQEILAGTRHVDRLAEDELHLAFLDPTPLKPGHAVVIPRREIDYIYDLSDEEVAAIFVFARRVARAIGAVVPCKKVATAVIGLETRHAHIHLVPADAVAELNFAGPRVTVSAAEGERLAHAISAAL